MANERLAQARALIKAKQYQQARRTLTGVDHPTARAWLMKLDEIAPEVSEDDPFSVFDAPAAQPVSPQVKPKPKQTHRARNLLLALVISIALVGFGYFVYLQASQRSYLESRRVSAEATLHVFCTIRLRLSDARCTQWVNETFDADINRVSDVLFCDDTYGMSGHPEWFVDCLARNRIYVPR